MARIETKNCNLKTLRALFLKQERAHSLLSQVKLLREK